MTVRIVGMSDALAANNAEGGAAAEPERVEVSGCGLYARITRADDNWIVLRASDAAALREFLRRLGPRQATDVVH